MAADPDDIFILRRPDFSQSFLGGCCSAFPLLHKVFLKFSFPPLSVHRPDIIQRSVFYSVWLAFIFFRILFDNSQKHRVHSLSLSLNPHLPPVPHLPPFWTRPTIDIYSRDLFTYITCWAQDVYNFPRIFLHIPRSHMVRRRVTVS